MLSAATNTNTGTPQAQVIVHRAAGGAVAENSLAGLQQCIERGYDWAEVDVRRTSDGRHVLMHDASVERTTNGVGLVSELTHAQLSAFSLRSGSTGDAASRVPLLAETLATARGRIGLYLDCRDVDPRQLHGELAAAGSAANLILCLNANDARVWRTLDRTLPLAFFCDAWSDETNRQIEEFAPVVLETPGGKISEDIAKRARTYGTEVICLALGDADHPAVWTQAIDLGARWIMTDQPERVRDLLVARYT